MCTSLTGSLYYVCRVDFPFLVLLVSGGNCILAVARGVGDFKVLGVTWDDAPGEAFDKVINTPFCDV